MVSTDALAAAENSTANPSRMTFASLSEQERALAVRKKLEEASDDD